MFSLHVLKSVRDGGSYGMLFTQLQISRSVSVRIEANKKADVAEYPEVFDHVGLLVNGPPGTEGVAPYLVIRLLTEVHGVVDSWPTFGTLLNIRLGYGKTRHRTSQNPTIAATCALSPESWLCAYEKAGVGI
jgi:hypothetical protein